MFFIVCVLQRIIRSEKDRQEFVMAEALGISVDVGGSVKVWVIGQKVCVTNPNKLENL